MALLFVLLALCAAGCTGGDDLSAGPVHDLIAELPAAEVTAESVGVDLVPESHRLLSGWAAPEQDLARQRSFRWALGGTAVAEVQVLEKRELELVLRARPFTFPGSGSQRVEVTWNGTGLGEIELPPRLAEHRLAVPAEALRVGKNRLALGFAYHRRPSDVVAGSRDERELAAAVYGLSLAGPRRQADAPRVDLEGRRLAIPYGVQVDYFLKVEGPAELRVDSWTVRGDGRLDVLWRTEDGDEELAGTVGAGVRGAAIELPAAEGEARVARLRLRSLGGEGAVVLHRPVLRTAARAAARETRRGAQVPPDALPDVLVYMIDTLRSDRLGCYGHDGGLTPEIDAFASRAIVFESSIAQSSWTRSSVASLLTGLWPPEHGALKRRHKLGEDVLTLPEILADAGYDTAAFVTNPNVTAAFGFDQGFAEFTDLGITARSGEVTAAVVEWLGGRDGDRPFFLYVHTLDPHDPYDPPPEHRARHASEVRASVQSMQKVLNDLQARRRPVTPRLVERLESLYEAEIAANDASFGVLLDALKARSLYDGAWIFVVSDHGEEFYEHERFRHGRTLYEESVRVPLVVKPPGLTEGRRVKEPVQHIDVVPTLLRSFGLPVPSDLDGRDLLAAEIEPRPVFSYLHLDGAPRASVLAEGWKLVQRRDGDRLTAARLFDLAADPAEKTNLADAEELRRGYLASLLRRRIQGGAELRAEEIVLDEDLRRRLEALGYLNP